MAAELASIVQSAHIKHQPSVEHDVNPSMAADEKIPASIVSPQQLRSDDEDIEEDVDHSDASSTSTLPSDIIRPLPRRPPTRHGHLPLPDLRFEQTYLASLKNADTYGKIAYITIRDQVLLPLAQGIGYHMIIMGWRYFNRGSKFAGETLGAKVRKWWWGVNGWKIPNAEARDPRVKDVKDFYVGRFGTSMGD